jgi:hypothetical protein
MALFRRRSMSLVSKEHAMKSKPEKLPVIKTEEKDQKLYVTVELMRSRWQRLLGADDTCQRTFGLDSYGQSVYRACDGKTSVKQMIKKFSRSHNISQAESELSVSMFLKTLMSKGLVGMHVAKEMK